MIINKISLLNFRNVLKEEHFFSSCVTIILGDNASGKTNLLESIFLLSHGKSFRDINDRELIHFGCELARMKGEVSEGNRDKLELELVLTQGEVTGIKTPYKRCLINGVGKRVIDFVGHLKTVLFWPQDMELVTDSPKIRRDYLDFVLTQVDREYRRTLISYERGIRQRNRVLEAIRDNGAHRHQLLFWNQLIIKAGEYISSKREEYINFINNFPVSKLEFKSIPNFQFENYRIVYDKSVISKRRLDQYANEEIHAAVTLVGPHRDDMKFNLTLAGRMVDMEDMRDLSRFGSRGEQRLAVLWLKICELAYIEKETGDKPVLLLDDIFSELDSAHQQIVFEIIGSQQTILSTTDFSLLEKKKLKDMKLIKI